METIAFLAVAGCLLIVALWYVANEAAGSSGETGFLALESKATSPMESADPRKRRPTPDFAARRRRRFATRVDPAYRAKDAAPRLGERKKRD